MLNQCLEKTGEGLLHALFLVIKSMCLQFSTKKYKNDRVTMITMQQLLIPNKFMFENIVGAPPPVCFRGS